MSAPVHAVWAAYARSLRHRDGRHADPDLVRAVDAARLLSLDVFDTLLLRAAAHPHDVFFEVGRRAIDKGWLPSHLTPAHVRALRVSAEQRARAARAHGAPAEVTLEAIWAAMPALASSDPEQLAALEVEVEAETCFLNPVIWRLVLQARRRRIPVVLASDMYLAPRAIERLLEANGCPAGTFDAILVSSEGLGAKWDGRLFERLANLYPHIPREHVLHVGDNPRSDVEQAQRAGFRAWHYPLSTALADDVDRLERLRCDRPLTELRSLRRLAASLADAEREDLRWWYELGAIVLGPFLAVFADWVVTECATRGIRIVRPLMREGAMLARLIERAAVAEGVSLDVAPLHASRAATWLPALERFDDEAVRALCARPRLTVGEAMRVLGIEPVPPPFERQAARLAADPAIVRELCAYLSEPAVRQRIETWARAVRGRAAQFLAASLDSADAVATVDLGFHATTGLALERIAQGALRATWHHLLALGAESVDRAWFDGRDVRAFAGGPGEAPQTIPALVQHAAVLEALLVSGATTLGYVTRGRRAVAETEPSRTPAAQAEAIDACHRGIASYQDVWLWFRALHPARAARLAGDRVALAQQLQRLIDLPSVHEAERLGTLLHEHNNGSAACQTLGDPRLLPADADPDEFLAAASGGGLVYGRSWLWPQGVAVQRWPGHLESRWELTRGDAAGLPVFVRLARQARRQGIRECLVYGAGDAGRRTAAALRGAGIMVRAFVDRNQSLWGSVVDGLAVMAPAQAVSGPCHTYVVGSIAFADQIRADLERLYSGRGAELRVVAHAHAQDRAHAA